MPTSLFEPSLAKTVRSKTWSFTPKDAWAAEDDSGHGAELCGGRLSLSFAAIFQELKVRSIQVFFRNQCLFWERFLCISSQQV